MRSREMFLDLRSLEIPLEPDLEIQVIPEDPEEIHERIQGACKFCSLFSKLNISPYKGGRRKLCTCTESLVYTTSTWRHLVCFSMSDVTHLVNRGEIVSGVQAGRNNKEISEFNNIPMSMMKKHKKDYMDFIDAGNSPEDYDIMRKPHKRHSNAHNHKIVARVQELVDTDSSKRTWDTNLIKGQLRQQNCNSWRRQKSY